MRKGRKDSASAGPSMGMCHQEHHPQALGGYRCRTERAGDPALGVITGRESSVKHQETFLPPRELPQWNGLPREEMSFSPHSPHLPWRGRKDFCMEKALLSSRCHRSRSKKMQAG